MTKKVLERALKMACGFIKCEGNNLGRKCPLRCTFGSPDGNCNRTIYRALIRKAQKEGR